MGGGSNIGPTHQILQLANLSSPVQRFSRPVDLLIGLCNRKGFRDNMPRVDSEQRVTGLILREDPTTSNYSQSLLVINFSSRLLSLYPVEAAGATDFTEYIPIEEIKCSYITKVSVVTASRPKVLNCFELVTTGVSRFFSVNSIEERDEWIDAIKQSSMSHKAYLPDTKDKVHCETAYRNQIIGGVIQRKPMKPEAAGTDERTDLTSSGPASVELPSGPTSPERKKYQLIVKAGHATKCGAVMKNWKRRFFVLSDQSLGYYKCIEEVDPIKTVAVSDMLSVGPSKIHASKDHLLELVTPSRTYYIQADTGLAMKEWIEAFQSVISQARSTKSMPVSTKERTASDHMTIQPYDASPKIVAATNQHKEIQDSDLSPGEHSNGDTNSIDDTSLVGIPV